MRNLFLFLLAASISLSIQGQVVITGADSSGNISTGRVTTEPPGYYAAAIGLGCASLKTTLSNIITTGMTPKTYGDLWIQYLVSDIKPREVGPGTSPDVIWDVYSDNPAGPDPYNFTPGPVASGGQQDNGSAVSGEGQLYNREHSVPLSWFNGSTSTPGPATDYFHIFPTDKKVNADRANFIYGVVNSPSITSANGGKLGPNTISGLSGTAFEPINEYKGDLARAFFYFVTRYETNMPAWESASTDGDKAFDGTTWPSVEAPYLQMMLQWHTNDPVSQKELDRNDAGYIYQGNRNPFIDHPEFAGQVWSVSCGSLPVEIVDFNGTYRNNKVVLDWSTDRANGLRNFVIERSLDGGASFQYAGNVNWVQGMNTYSFTDNVTTFEGTVLYRLKLIDENLVFKYSKIVFVKLPAKEDLIVLYPNPVTDRITASFRTINTLQWRVLIIDLSGRILQQGNWQPGQSTYTVPVQQLPAGLYILQIISTEKVNRSSFVIQR